jgi:secreted trypsin-like serine protease
MNTKLETAILRCRVIGVTLSLAACSPTPTISTPVSYCAPKPSNQDSSKSALNIVNGQEAGNTDKIERATYIVQIIHELANGSPSSMLCTAVATDKRVLITAAHCFDKPNKAGEVVKSTKVLATGELKIANVPMEDMLEAESTYVHPQWNGSFNDIALVKLKKDLPAGSVLAGIELNISNLKNSTPVVLVGYGITGETATSSAGVKRRTESMVDQIISSATFPNTKIENQVRLLDTSGQKRSSCFGDSGGPAFVKDSSLVFGVTKGVDSTVQPIANVNCQSGDVNYTLIAPYRDWIESSAGIKLSDTWRTADGASDPVANASGAAGGGVGNSNATAAVQGNSGSKVLTSSFCR